MQTSLVVVMLLGGAALLVGVLLTASVAGRALRRALRFAALAAQRTEAISDLSSGIRAIVGFAGLGADRQPLTGPLSGRPCVLYQLSVRHHGKTELSRREALPCVLHDGTGDIEIDLGGAELELEPRTWKGDATQGLPPSLDHVLAERLSALGRGGSPTSVELEERAVHVGQRLHVTGTILRAATGPSFMSGRPIVASDRPFGERARREGLVALAGVALALFVVSVVVSLVAAALGRSGW